VTFTPYTGQQLGATITFGDAAVAVTNVAYSVLVVTLTATNTFAVGAPITVMGVNAGAVGGVTNVNGNWTCKTGTNATTIVFDVSDQPVGDATQAVLGGVVTTRYVAPAPVTNMAYSTKEVTLTATNTYSVGDVIKVTGVNAGFTVTNIDGTWTCKTGTNGTTVVFDVTDQPVGTSPQTITVGAVTKAMKIPGWETITITEDGRPEAAEQDITVAESPSYTYQADAMLGKGDDKVTVTVAGKLRRTDKYLVGLLAIPSDTLGELIVRKGTGAGKDVFTDTLYYKGSKSNHVHAGKFVTYELTFENNGLGAWSASIA